MESLSRCGSPPRGRGKENTPFRGWTKKRITPAWAGKSAAVSAAAALSWDHPRVGGEKFLLCRCAPDRPGSPPRGRGKDIQCTNGKRAQRITPAWAGKSSALCLGRFGGWDHPRVGGEKPFFWPTLRFLRGSPPRGRGKVCIASGLRVSDGITPAWAGKSHFWDCQKGVKKDHPRVGGEKSHIPV